MKFILTTFLNLFIFATVYAQPAAFTDIKIVQKPISFNQKRADLSLKYLKDRHGLIQDQPTIQPKIIVLHFTGSGTLNSNWNYFNRTEIENARSFNKNQSTLNVSAHFLVDRDGTIYQLLDETTFARHTIGLNYCAIGVENIGSDKNPLTQAQVEANTKLVKYLCGKFPEIEYLIGHSEYGVFKGSDLWKESNPKYFTHKIDPGAAFMKKVRAGLTEYNLKEKP